MENRTDFVWPSVCRTCNKVYNIRCPIHSSHNTPDLSYPGDWDSYAMKSFPDVVQLCKSSIPGKKYGVAAKQHIPVGTWIGPYEGKRINPDEINPNMDSSYLWEVWEQKQNFCVSITDLLRVDLFEYLLTHWVKCFLSELIKAISRLCLLMLVLWNHLFIEFISLYSELVPTRFYKRELTINLVLCFDLRFTKMASSCTILMRQTSPPQAGCDS